MTSLTASHFSLIFINFFILSHNSQPHRRLKKTKTTAMQRSNDQSVEEEECSICLDDLRKYGSTFHRASCCGKGLHVKCRDGVLKSSMSAKQKRHCVMCRTKYPASQKEAIEQLRPWVEKGKAWAQSMLGQRYEYGNGVDQSYQQAKELFELAATQGHATAQFNLGQMYYKGQGVDQSYERAAEYWDAAAKQGYTDAQFNLGVLYCNGQGVEQSFETARELWMKAAEQGEDSSIKQLQDLDKHEGRTTPSFVPKPLECATCYRPHDPSEHKLRPCNRCHRVYYCGRECQVKHWKRKDWKSHKQNCKKKSK